MEKLFWYYNRLRCMSFSEILQRVQNLVNIYAEKFGFFRASIVIDEANITTPVIFNKIACWDRVHQQASKICDGYITVFAIEDFQFGPDYNWLEDPQSSIVAPLIFGKLLDYRDEDKVGNIKYLWEPSRHLQLVTLAVAYADNNNQDYLSCIKDQLSSWLEQNPYLQGPHWVSSLELGIRLINWSIVWNLIGKESSVLFDGAEGKKLKKDWMTSIYQHMHFIEGYYSGHSSANNHLIGEAAGVYVASRTWPMLPNGDEWGIKAKTILEEQAIEQNFEDGVNKEQAISYQQFVLDFLVIPMVVGESTGDRFSQSFYGVVEKMLEYLVSLFDINGNIPMIGDADDGYVFRLAWDESFCPYKSLLATGAIIYDRADFAKLADSFDDKARLIVGSAEETKFDELRNKPGANAQPNSVYKHGGYYILGNGFGTADEVKMVFDAGPLGLGNIAAHGHADALSFWLSVKGREILIDPGTYAYHTEKKWRNYFRGTSAHNTIRIDEQDQSEIGGNFMWLRKANATCHDYQSNEEFCSITASHDGYTSLEASVSHQRMVYFDKLKNTILIEDTLECTGNNLAEQFWHFSEFCDVKLEDRILRISNDKVDVSIELDESLEHAEIFAGDDRLPLGWTSRQFDKKITSSSVRAAVKISGKKLLKTVINL